MEQTDDECIFSLFSLKRFSTYSNALYWYGNTSAGRLLTTFTCESTLPLFRSAYGRTASVPPPLSYPTLRLKDRLRVVIVFTSPLSSITISFMCAYSRSK